VSIGKRIINLAKSELNSLLERAARLDDDDDDDDRPRDPDGFGEPPPPNAAGPRRDAPRGRPVRLEELTDQELEAEIERRRLDREIEERSRRASAQGQARRAYGGNAGSTSGGSSSSGARSSGPRGSGPGDAVTRAYAALEVPPGSDFETVRKAYRNMMRKYHPDRHAATPEKQKAANELAQKLTESYRLLEKRLRIR
jgi:DnaJ-domain-containing protein 1